MFGDQARSELLAERDRLLWLAELGFPAARVLDWNDASARQPVAAAKMRAAATAGTPEAGVVTAETPGCTVAADGTPEPATGPAQEAGSWAVLVTSAVPGIPISSVTGYDIGMATRSLALILRDLHALPAASCPFDRTLSVTLVAAQQVVDLHDLDALLSAASRASASEQSDLVVCHGDACLPNVLVDPDTLRPTGIVDVGRLGVADRHQDLALATRSLADPDLNPDFGPDSADAFLDSYVSATGLDPSRVDVGRLKFYRLLDEFF